MKNMAVGASASVSIVKDGVLWGLIACHHAEPRLLTYDQRAGCRALAGGLARQIKAKEEAEAYRERLRLRGFEDEVVAGLSARATLDEALREALPEVRRMLGADGAAVLRGPELITAGETPKETEVRDLAAWALASTGGDPIVSERLAEIYPPAEAFADKAAGLLVSVVSAEEPFLVLWFRAEQVEVVNWAGNPHKAAELRPGEVLTPRASFEAWSEAVRGRARRWTLAEVEIAARLRQALLDARQTRRLKELNARLSETLKDKEALLEQKELLLREVNHRIQNSLQLVSSFLGLQARASDDQALKDSFEEARRRLSAVALVHRRLYRADQIENVDLARYLEELCGEMQDSMGPEWVGRLRLNIAPVLIPTDRAVTLGLVLTELVINANKYAYDGAPGPIEITLEELGSRFRLIVADHGRGKHEPRQGFGTRMMTAMVNQLGGTLDYNDNKPGLRAVLTAQVSTH
jgi:light-regulated signal transduction histidine kinase (bacteriophytochrome)